MIRKSGRSAHEVMRRRPVDASEVSSEAQIPVPVWEATVLGRSNLIFRREEMLQRTIS